MNTIIFIKEERKKKRITQFELAIKSGVSLPSIQKIEAGKMKPTIEILEKILFALGYSLTIIPNEPDWDFLISIGLPISCKKEVSILNQNLDKEKIAYEITNAAKFLLLNQSKKYERFIEALRGLLFALKTHYSFIFKKLAESIFCKILTQGEITGRDIKLRNMALAKIWRYV